MKEDNLIVSKSMDYAVRIVRLYQYLISEKKEYILSKQILRSGTSVGANVKEAERGQSKPDFISKMSIALKECSETEYWLDLLHKTDYITDKMYDSLYADNLELLKMLTSIINSAKKNQ